MTLGTLGTTSIVLTLAGYWAGRYGETTGRGRRYAAPLAAFAISILAGFGGVALHFLLGEPVAARDALVTARAERDPRGGARPRRLSHHRRDLSSRPEGSSARVRWSSYEHPHALRRAAGAVEQVPPARSRRRGALPAHAGPRLPRRASSAIVALAVFAVLFFRLWSLQVLSGDTYLAAAQGNQLRTIRLEAPRGTILDRHGRVIVDNVAGTAVKLWVGDLPSEPSLRGHQAPRRRPARAAAPAREGGRRAHRRPAQPDHGEDGRGRGPGRLPVRALLRVPRRPDPADLPAALPVPVARARRCSGTSARCRRASSTAKPQRLQAGRQGGEDRRRVARRRVPPRRRPARPRSASTRWGARRGRSSCGARRGRATRCA